MSYTEDMDVLSKYEFCESNEWNSFGYNKANNDTLLAVKDGRLITVKTSDVTYINRFLGLFNIGVLAGINVTITQVEAHLLQYNFKELEECPALTNLRKIGYRCFAYPYPSKLIEHVATLTDTDWGQLYLSPTTTAADILRHTQCTAGLSQLNEKHEIKKLNPTEKIVTYQAVSTLYPKKRSYVG